VAVPEWSCIQVPLPPVWPCHVPDAAGVVGSADAVAAGAAVSLLAAAAVKSVDGLPELAAPDESLDESLGEATKFMPLLDPVCRLAVVTGVVALVWSEDDASEPEAVLVVGVEDGVVLLLEPVPADESLPEVTDRVWVPSLASSHGAPEPAGPPLMLAL
jgi:hypothetical protein